MAVRPTVIWPDPRLREPTVAITTIDDSVRELYRDLCDSMYAENGLGMAAPQLGEARKMFIVEPKLAGRAETDPPVCFMNPEVLEASEGMPESARRLRELFLAHDALLIASPENNQSVSSLLKNVIDWLSRSIGDGTGEDSGLAPYRGKVGAFMTATPGPYGGVRGLPHLRQILSGLGVVVLPAQVQLARADRAFDAAGHLVDEHAMKSVRAVAHSLVRTAGRLADPDSRSQSPA